MHIIITTQFNLTLHKNHSVGHSPQLPQQFITTEGQLLVLRQHMRRPLQTQLLLRLTFSSHTHILDVQPILQHRLDLHLHLLVYPSRLTTACTIISLTHLLHHSMHYFPCYDRQFSRRIIRQQRREVKATCLLRQATRVNSTGQTYAWKGLFTVRYSSREMDRR